MLDETVCLNDRPVPWQPGLTLAALLAREGIAPERVATALNAHFVPRAAREHLVLQAADQVTTFEAIVGG